MTRRRDISSAQQQARQVKRIPDNAVRLEVAIESALRGGYCPACGARIGRAVRDHYVTCGGA